MARASPKSGLRRFESADIDPSKAVGLRPDHPAVIEGRTIFPTSVTGSQQSPRFLVSGHNNTKLGAEITKGERAGWPIYHLTLEERATCPRSCHQFRGCYGNAMPYARRHAADEGFMEALRAEVLTVARQHPEGLLVRLHTLGDFFSVEYVLLWGELLARLPQLHVFGYTARREDDADPLSRRIAKAVRFLTQGAWSRFAIRTSHTEPGRERSIVVGAADPDLPKVIVCPAQTHTTETCGSCGLCWAPNARDKTIAFLRHGMKRPTGPRPQASPPASPQAVREPVRPPAPVRTGIAGTGMRSAQQAAMLEHLKAVADASGDVRDRSLAALAEGAGIPAGSALFIIRELAEADHLTIVQGERVCGKAKPKNIYRLKAATPSPAKPAVARAPVAAPSNPKPDPRRTALAPRYIAPKPPTLTDEPRSLGLIDETEAASAAEATLMTLRVGQCHWPLEDSPTGHAQRYCAKPCGSAQYCKDHAARLYAKGRAR
jgi:hypothetical protein